MTLQPQHECSIPEETRRVAHTAYPKGNIYMKMRDALGTIYQDQAFAHLFPHNGRPVEEAIQAELHQANLSPQQHLRGFWIRDLSSTGKQSEAVWDRGCWSRPVDVKWQAHAQEGFDISQFVVDWEQKLVICPQGKRSPSWTPALDTRGHQVLRASSRSKTVVPAPVVRSRIHSEKPDQRRTITVRPQEQHEDLQAARRRQQTPISCDDMPCEKASKPPSHKESEPLVCVALVILARQKRISSILALQLPSIWFALSVGSTVTCLLQRAFLPMKGCTMPLRGFASSVKVDEKYRLIAYNANF